MGTGVGRKMDPAVPQGWRCSMHIPSAALPVELRWCRGNLCSVVIFLFNVVWELNMTNSEDRKMSEKCQNVAVLVCEAVSF